MLPRAYLSEQEALELLAALQVWAEEARGDPEWYQHIGEPPAPELTIAVAR